MNTVAFKPDEILRDRSTGLIGKATDVFQPIDGTWKTILRLPDGEEIFAHNVDEPTPEELICYPLALP